MIDNDEESTTITTSAILEYLEPSHVVQENREEWRYFVVSETFLSALQDTQTSVFMKRVAHIRTIFQTHLEKRTALQTACSKYLSNKTKTTLASILCCKQSIPEAIRNNDLEMLKTQCAAREEKPLELGYEHLLAILETNNSELVSFWLSEFPALSLTTILQNEQPPTTAIEYCVAHDCSESLKIVLDNQQLVSSRYLDPAWFRQTFGSITNMLRINNNSSSHVLQTYLQQQQIRFWKQLKQATRHNRSWFKGLSVLSDTIRKSLARGLGRSYVPQVATNVVEVQRFYPKKQSVLMIHDKEIAQCLSLEFANNIRFECWKNLASLQQHTKTPDVVVVRSCAPCLCLADMFVEAGRCLVDKIGNCTVVTRQKPHSKSTALLQFLSECLSKSVLEIVRLVVDERESMFVVGMLVAKP